MIDITWISKTIHTGALWATYSYKLKSWTPKPSLDLPKSDSRSPYGCAI
jgi:hypothetical protein